MEPSSSPTMSRVSSNHGSRMRESTVRSREATPAATKVQTIINVEDEESVQKNTQLALGFKEDLMSMRKYLTCSICVQLLYEPWILQCGHTYCYNCLCQWFIPNRRKKTCPECRAPVKQIPAPAFLVKNLVEIFINRGQLMPYDETVEQHKLNNAEVTEMVEKDKNSPEGLFGGSFPIRQGELWRDEADGVMRCPSCGHEHEGGPTCDICGAEFDDIYGFSDMDEDGDLSDIDVGYDEDVGLEIGAEYQMDADIAAAHIRNNARHYAFGGPAHQHILSHYHARHLSMDDTEDDSEDATNSDTSNQDISEDEDAGSLEDFIAPEDDDSQPISHQRRVNRRVVTIISDEEGEEEDDEDDESEDEGGAITNRRRPRPGWTRSSENPSRSILISEDGNGSSTNGSEFGDDDAHETRMRLRASDGWSPLDEGDDEDNNGIPHDDYRGYATTEDERASDESDSETIGNPNSDAEDDDDRSRQGLSETPRHGNADFEQFPDDYASSIDGDATPIDYSRDRDDGSNNYHGENENENRYDYDTDGDHSTNMDRDGDTEMSVSPSVSRSSRDASVESHYGENLGVANEMAEVEDDLSDTPIGFGSRRQSRRNPVAQQYDPRISMLFAEHQNTVRNAQNPEDMSPWGDDLNGHIRVEPASRSRRRAQNHHQAQPISNNGARNSHHRIMQPHGLDRVRTSRSSPPRAVPVSSRNNRLQRQYPM
ncbi:e42ec272-cb4d-4d27-a3f5-e91593fcb98f [Sclerotinia trifoliorum]|uniref:E42ec272-cb4d-4d27-a3f5-e91593fcb98f n=1 Tax=Sclerotinia trifoliorum TaxID=28548 RepID=A0A8H2VZF1_9HELO|nr:e42ec272-cb4d-4d27-a3f5-e91593fcb98f [Sclerotinia trifoliorum]